jgi:hypothetical protein
MIKGKFYYFFIIVAIVISISAIVVTIHRRSGGVSRSQTVSGIDTLDLISAATINAYRMNDLRLQPAALMSFTDGQTCSLSKIVSRGATIVLQYSQLNCEICVDSALSYLNAFLKRTGTSNVVIIASTDSRRWLSFFVRINHLDPQTVYYINNKDLDGLYGREVPNFPFVYFTDSTLSVSDVFFPVKEIPQLSDIYYDEMLAKHFGKKENSNKHL